MDLHTDVLGVRSELAIYATTGARMGMGQELVSRYSPGVPLRGIEEGDDVAVADRRCVRVQGPVRLRALNRKGEA